MIADDITWYLTSLTAFSEKKPSTIAAYAADLQKLAVFADDTGVEHAEEMDETFLQDFLLNLKNSGASKSGIRRAVACLHGFFASLVAEGKLSRDPSENLSGTQDAKDAAEKENLPPLSEKEQKALLATAAGEDLLSLRDRALLSLLLSTGIRTGELIKIHIRDIDFLTDFIQICPGEEGARSVPFSGETEEALRAYIGAGRDIFLSRNSLLFLNRDGEPISRQGVWKLVKRAGAKAGIPGAVTPARIRKSVAAGLLARGVPERKIAQILGWKEATGTEEDRR